MGAATAELFASSGAKVVVARSEQVRDMAGLAVRAYGRLDVAVNNAAGSPDKKPLAEMDEDEFDALLRVNLKGVALCLKYEIGQLMAKGGPGSIINIASVSGIRPQPADPAYIASKYAVIGLTKSAAIDYSCHGKAPEHAGSRSAAGGDCPGFPVAGLRRIVLRNRRDAARGWRLHRDVGGRWRRAALRKAGRTHSVQNARICVTLPLSANA